MSMTGIQDRPIGDGGRPPADEAVPTTMTPTTENAKHWAKVYRTGIASGASSVLSTVTAFPLDSIKTRMQAYRYANFTECVQHTYKSEGARGFWRGALAPVFSVTAVRMTSFSIYQKAKYKYSAAIGKATGSDEPLIVVNRPGSIPTPATMLCFGAAGATAGSIITLLSCPFELTKLSAQISTLMAKSATSSMDDPINVRQNYQQKGTFKMAKSIVAHRGFLGLYSGFSLHLLRDTIGTAIYFTTYESTKQLLVKFQGSDSPTSPLSVAMAGGFCGLASWACIYPIDTAKTHYQRNCLTRAKGQPVKVPRIQFFKLNQYRGLGVSMARSCVINTIFFSSFEFIKKRINALPDTVIEPTE